MRRLLPFMLCILVTVASSACLDPTQVTVTVRTNAPCADAARWKGVAIYVGEPGVDVESRAPALSTSSCDATGSVGSLVITPSGKHDAQVGIRVVAGLDKKPEDCGAASYAGCIVARRTVSFIAHSSNTVIVDLTTDCTGRGCDLNHTCVNGSCTDTLTATPPVSPDGGVPSTGAVRCGDNGVFCPANEPTNACCLAFDPVARTTTGDCRPTKDCPPANVTLQCGSASDCAGVVAGDAGGEVATCCLGLDSSPPGNRQAPYRAYASYCALYSACGNDSANGRYQLCEDRQACPTVNVNACQPLIALPGYFYCGGFTH